MDPVVRAGLAAPKGLLEIGGTFVEAGKLCLPLVGGFLTPSVRDARGRVVELEGETALVRAGALVAVVATVDGFFSVVEDESAGFAAGVVTFGAKEALRPGPLPNNEADVLLARLGTMAGLEYGADDSR